MFMAKWQIDARFGHKQDVIDLMRRWLKDIGSQAGTDAMDVRLMTGSIGTKEATLEVHHHVDTLAQLERFFEAIGRIDAHRQWSRELEPHVVSGTASWSIYRVL
jgi:hypothetical protein